MALALGLDSGGLEEPQSPSLGQPFTGERCSGLRRLLP